MLGTPPAFILSQDQTLMLKFSPGQKSLLAISFPFTVINRFCSLNNSLKNFQGFFSTVQLSRFAVHLSDATLTFYHVRSCLSTTFLTFFEVFVVSFSRTFHRSRSGIILYHLSTSLSTAFWSKKNIFWKENGERGIWTLAPVFPTYTLSRGASSASWVFLLKFVFQTIFFFTSSLTHTLLY